MVSLVTAMAQGGVEEPSSGRLHPFFIRAAGSDVPSTPSELCADSPASGPATESIVLNSDDDHRRKKRRKTDVSPSRAGCEPRNQRRKRKNAELETPPTDGGIMSHLVRSDPPPFNADSMAATSGDGKANLMTSISGTPARKPTGSKTEPAATNATLQLAPHQATKILKFNPKTGTLGSPPKPRQTKGQSMVVCIRYGRDEQTRQAMGAKVLQILNGELQIPSTSTGPHDSPSAAQDHEETSVHPFFSAKSRPPPSKSIEPEVSTRKIKEPRRSIFMSTPVSPRKPRNSLASSGSHSTMQLGTKSLGTKIPGAMLPMWPAAGMSHVRDGDACTSSNRATRWASEGEPSKKSKGHAVAIPSPESLLTHLVDHMHLDALRQSLPGDEDGFAPAPVELRLPSRRFESGRKLQNRIRPRLAVPATALTGTDESSQDELSQNRLPRAHPAIRRHYQSLQTSLSAFDKSTCESLPWTQKYAPITAAQVLQTGKEASLLKQWLQALQVQSVESGGDASGDKGKAKFEPWKARKRRAKLQDFVVYSDDEASELDELSDAEGDENAVNANLTKRSVIRAGNASSRSSKAAGRLRNTVVISGPHGCGKTASVYAVAKELGFEVFELNPSSRRSGKDMLEKVGDMTRNHLVQQQQVQGTCAEHETNDAAEASRSSKQGMMTSFFKPRPTGKASQLEGGKAKQKPEKSTKGSAPRSQKQSLILLEEADVLYEEDKQFWATVMTMMSQSKRPFIVTCNDENLIPIQSLSLQGIFRFSPPPASLAVDLCLLIAANEGHMLGTAAVESLYRSRGNDLRATISELNCWCQIGVGDRKGGFEWFYPRWPKGSDLDDKGDVVRVVSECTYLHGMGWIGRDPIAAAPEPLAMEQESFLQAWNSWQLDMGDWYDSHHAAGPPPSTALTSPLLRTSGIEALAAYDTFYGAMSDADMYSRGAFGSKLEELMDPTLPVLAGSTRDDFIIGHALLEADAAAASTSASAVVAITLKSLARQALLCSSTDGPKMVDKPVLAPVDEGKAISILDASFRRHRRRLTRQDISLAFDPIAVSAMAAPSSQLDPSVFDRPMKPIILDVAPWIRGIIAFEHRLMQERLKLSKLLSEGGGGDATKKRMRTTRSAYSALEGGQRWNTRRERYFGDCLATGVVMSTGAGSFQDAVAEAAALVRDPRAVGRESP